MLNGVPVATIAGVATISSAFGAMIVALIRTWPTLKKIQSEEDNSLRETLLGRVTALEQTVADVTRELAAEREARAVERVLHANELGVMRHRLNNESTSLDALLMLIETSPDKLKEAVAHVIAQRAKQAELMAHELAALASSRIEAESKHA